MADRYLLLINIFKCSSHKKIRLKNVYIVSSKRTNQIILPWLLTLTKIMLFYKLFGSNKHSKLTVEKNVSSAAADNSSKASL